MHYTNKQIGRKKLLTFFFYYDNKDFFLFMRTHGIYKKIKPSQILIILQCIASVIRPEVVMQIKKKTEKQKTHK